MATHRIYLDNNSTTPVDPRVLEVMLPYLKEHFGNAASKSHAYGWIAEEAVDYSREQIAQLLDVEAREVIFTSGATESDNLGLKGAFEMYSSKGNHIITVKTEHKAVLDACERIEKIGGLVTYLGVSDDGMIDLDELEDTITDQTILVCIMWANNETGVIQPMREIGDICERHGILLMSDATQAVGKIIVHPRELGIHLMSFSAHKMYGPKGVGGLFVNFKNPRVKVMSQIDGGGHERGMRSGTLNVPAIVGFGKAAELSNMEMKDEYDRLNHLRNALESRLLENLEETFVNGNRKHRMPNVSNISFRHVEGEALMRTFNQDIAVSSGSACTSASLDPSHVLMAMGMSEDMAHAAIRFSLGRFNTTEDIELAVDSVVKGVNQLREMSPVWEMFKIGSIQ